MDDGITLSVTMVRPGPVPVVEVGAYEYVGRSLPSVGETILIRKVVGMSLRRSADRISRGGVAASRMRMARQNAWKVVTGKDA